MHNNFVPYFGQSSDTSDGIASFGDQLMFTNVSSEVEQILFEQRSTALPRAQAIGREADGSWATAKLKAYPAGLCKALAAVFHHMLPPPGLKSHPEEFSDFVQNLMAGFDLTLKLSRDRTSTQILRGQ